MRPSTLDVRSTKRFVALQNTMTAMAKVARNWATRQARYLAKGFMSTVRGSISRMKRMMMFPAASMARRYTKLKSFLRRGIGMVSNFLRAKMLKLAQSTKTLRHNFYVRTILRSRDAAEKPTSP